MNGWSQTLSYVFDPVQFKLAMSQILTTKMISVRLQFAIYGVDQFRICSPWPLFSSRKATPSSHSASWYHINVMPLNIIIEFFLVFSKLCVKTLLKSFLWWWAFSSLHLNQFSLVQHWFLWWRYIKVFSVLQQPHTSAQCVHWAVG